MQFQFTILTTQTLIVTQYMPKQSTSEKSLYIICIFHLQICMSQSNFSVGELLY